MRRTAFVTVAAGLVLLAGCDNSAEPSAPPTSEDALTTATAEPAVATEEPTETEEVVATTEGATTEAPVEADGPPEMPAEAMEQTEEGAEAFVLHYLDMLNYTGRHPQVGLLEPLSHDECGTCDQFENAVSGMAADEHRYDKNLTEFLNSQPVHMGETAIVTATVDQPDVNVLDLRDQVVDIHPAESGVQMEFNLVWDENRWLVERIFLVSDS